MIRGFDRELYAVQHDPAQGNEGEQAPARQASTTRWRHPHRKFVVTELRNSVNRHGNPARTSPPAPARPPANLLVYIHSSGRGFLLPRALLRHDSTTPTCSASMWASFRRTCRQPARSFRSSSCGSILPLQQL